MSSDIENGFKNPNHLVRGTVVKSFKYAVSKETDSLQLDILVQEIIKLVDDKDLVVKKNALESLNSIVHN